MTLPRTNIVLDDAWRIMSRARACLAEAPASLAAIGLDA
jgi:hypothetical protein